MKYCIALVSLWIGLTTSSLAEQPSAKPWHQEPSKIMAPNITKGTLVLTDTKALQTKVLNEVSAAVMDGYITADQAAQFKEKLNAIGRSEGQYVSLGSPAPKEVVQHNAVLLKELCNELKKSIGAKPDEEKSINSMKVDLHKRISHALADEKINNLQANDFYARLAQIEADEGSLSDSGTTKEHDLQTVKERLDALKRDLDLKTGPAPHAMKQPKHAS